MRKSFWLAFLLLLSNISYGQNIKVICSERQKKNDEGTDPIIIKKCFIKNFKLISTGYPDYKGRYTFEEELYVKKNNKFIKIENSEMFNSDQSKLLSMINKKIQEDFKSFRSDPNSKDCFEGIDSIPTYSMNELKISFEGKVVGRFEIS